MISRRNMIGSAAAALAAGMTAQAHAADARSTERPMHRKDYELTEKDAVEQLKNIKWAVMATADKSGEPYAVAVHLIYQNGKLYFHGGNTPESRKLANLRQNPRVSICYVIEEVTPAGQLTANYKSVVVAGKAREITDDKEKADTIVALCKIHDPASSEKKVRDTFAMQKSMMSIWEIIPDKISGKVKAN